MNDPNGNENSAEIKITVRDTSPPDWSPTPTDFSIEFGTSFSYEVDASDPSGIGIYWVNDTDNFQIDERHGTIRNATALSVGVFWLDIEVKDSFGNPKVESIKITVENSGISPRGTNPNSFFITSLVIIGFFFTGYFGFLLRKFIIDF